jgi:hypothetical protein
MPLIQILLEPEQQVITIVFPPADFTHRDWRLAAVSGLARKHIPVRVNAISGGEGPARLAAMRYLESAPGLTGQYLPLDGEGAGVVLSLQG